jgi:diguanylate cyclase (GGDEF)-like protein
MCGNGVDTRRLQQGKIPNVKELTQKSLGLVREALFAMEPEEDVLTQYERHNFWKERLFDAGLPPAFIDVAKSYDFQWTDIVPALYTGKFGEQNVHFAPIVPPALCERFLEKLVRFAIDGSTNTVVGKRLGAAISTDLGVDGSIQSDIPPELTNLPNKQSLLSDLEAHLQKAKLVSLVFIDLDNFKQVNDQHGHAEGDNCLAEVVARCTAVLSGKGTLYRWGGDEFCALLLNFSGSEAAATAERIRGSVDALHPFGTIKVTASIGVVASDVREGTDPDSLVAAADEAMYVSKWTSKNRITTWPPSDAHRTWAQENRERAKSGQNLILERKDQTSEKQQKRKTRQQIAELLKEADAIRNGIEYNNSSSLQEKSGWELRVKQFLGSHLDESYAVRFMSPSHDITAFPVGIHSAMRIHWASLKARMAMLHDFIAELRD